MAKNTELRIPNQFTSTARNSGANFRAIGGSYGAIFACNEGNNHTEIGVTASGSPTGAAKYVFLYGDNANGFVTAVQGLYGAYWNDYADVLPCQKDLVPIPGKCYAYDQETGEFRLTKELGELACMGICSDTYGFATGIKTSIPAQENIQKNYPEEEIPENEIAFASAGFALAYVDKVYPTGTPLVCTKDGMLTKKPFFLQKDAVIATYWKPETKKTWFKKEVNGRSWVKIK